MLVVSCPGLRVLQADSNRVIIEHTTNGACYSLDPMVASLLQLLSQPEEVEGLSGLGGLIPHDIIDHLLRIGLLVDAERPFASFRTTLRRCLPTFLGCPEGDPGAAQICVVGMPTDVLSDTGSGAASGPATLRLAASFPSYQIDLTSGRPAGWYDYYAERQILKDITFADLGDIPLHPGDAPAETGAILSRIVHDCLAAGSFPLILGGDHSITAWAIAALTTNPISVLHLDAHSDLGPTINDSLPTNGSIARVLLRQPEVRHLVTIGIRGFLPQEEPKLRPGHQIVSASEARAIGAEGILELLPEGIPCYVTLDVDVLDPSVAPGTNAPVPGGLLFDEVRAILDAVGKRRQVIAADVVELNPSRDPYLLTARVAVHLAISLLSACFDRTRETTLAGTSNE